MSMTFNVSLKKRLLMLLFAFIVCYFILSIIAGLVSYKFGLDTRAMRIVTVLQDLLLFIAPAIITAVLVTRQPAELLCIDRRPPFMPLIMAACTLVVSIPAMNTVIWLNENMPLPQGLYDMLKGWEDSANAMVNAVVGGHTVPNLIVTLLIVGVMAGLSEELLFRGALQRILVTGRVNHHAAIWIAAAVFSLLHMQFFGFVPRMLLGAFFGYSLYWTRSLWVPIILHALNNSMYLIAQWFDDGAEKSRLDMLGAGSDYSIVICSAVLTVIGLMLVKRNSEMSASDKSNVEGR